MFYIESQRVRKILFEDLRCVCWESEAIHPVAINCAEKSFEPFDFVEHVATGLRGSF